MNQAHFEQFSKMLEAPNGMIYITGPTGSGKTTTLYMALQKLSNRKVNIATIEDPVEWNIPRVNQCQVNTVAGADLSADCVLFFVKTRILLWLERQETRRRQPFQYVLQLRVILYFQHFIQMMQCHPLFV